MAPGMTGAGSGRPKPAPFVRHFGALVSKASVPVTVTVGSDYSDTKVYHSASENINQRPNSPETQEHLVEYEGEKISVPLIALCYGRSGDKGDVANIGIIARSDEFYPYLRNILTAEVVAEHFAHFVQGTVTRYELPGIRALNFVLTQSLGGGGLSSLNIDRQGKSYAQNLLTMLVDIPASWGLPQSPYSRLNAKI